MTVLYDTIPTPAADLDLSIKNTFVHASLALPTLARTQSCPDPAPLRRTASVSQPKPILEESTSCDASCEASPKANCEASPKADGSDIDTPRVCRTPEPEPGTPDNTPLAVPPAYMLLCASALAHAAGQATTPLAYTTPSAIPSQEQINAAMMQMRQGPMMPQMPMMQQSTQQVPLMNMLQPQQMHPSQTNPYGYMNAPVDPTSQFMPMDVHVMQPAQPPNFFQVPQTGAYEAGEWQGWSEGDYEWDEQNGYRRRRHRRNRRKDPVQPEAGPKVFVGGLNPMTTTESLRKYFEAFGTVLDVAILSDGETKKSRGFGFVEFEGDIPEGILDREHMIEQRRCGVRRYEYAPAY
jgi:hypothetical protein